MSRLVSVTVSAVASGSTATCRAVQSAWPRPSYATAERCARSLTPVARPSDADDGAVPAAQLGAGGVGHAWLASPVPMRHGRGRAEEAASMGVLYRAALPFRPVSAALPLRRTHASASTQTVRRAPIDGRPVSGGAGSPLTRPRTSGRRQSMGVLYLALQTAVLSGAVTLRHWSSFECISIAQDHRHDKATSPAPTRRRDSQR